MAERIDLICVGDQGARTEWPLGRVTPVAADPAAVAALVRKSAAASNAVAWLFWDPRLGTPDWRLAAAVLERPGDVWHAGLRLGTKGLPRLLNHVAPVWMWNRDPDNGIEATSWRLSLRACLVRTEVLRSLGGPLPGFRSLDGAALELGHRYITGGALTRHVPSLLRDGVSCDTASVPIEDEVLFLRRRYGSRWAQWALGRAVFTGIASPAAAARAWLRTASAERFCPPPLALKSRFSCEWARVTALVPTVDRYPYLRVLLRQLEAQTLPPSEVIVVDQTARERRDSSLAAGFPGLPLRITYIEPAGQCSSRNAGLEQARGEYILLLDDDVEIPPDFIEKHLACVQGTGADACCGAIREPGAKDSPQDFRSFRASDVFPAGNTLLRRSALERSGLFDLAYERGERADGDLGMRLYLAGALIVLNPDISVLHHRAPTGGLRTHGARKTTYAGSRRLLLERHLPSASEVYMARRFFSSEQVREMLWLAALGTFSLHGSPVRRAAKAAMGLAALPGTVRRLHARCLAANRLLEEYPQIPALSGIAAPAAMHSSDGR